MPKTYSLNNRKEIWEPDLSIDDVLKRKNYTFRLLVVKINGKLIKKSDYQLAVIPQNADVQILHLMSGG